jgi:hypothetical protein
VDHRLVSSYNASQKGFTFLTIAVQWAKADFHEIVLVLLYGLFWNLSCTNLMISSSILDNSMSRTVTDSQTT